VISVLSDIQSNDIEILNVSTSADVQQNPVNDSENELENSRENFIQIHNLLRFYITSGIISFSFDTASLFTGMYCNFSTLNSKVLQWTVKIKQGTEEPSKKFTSDCRGIIDSKHS